MPDTSKDYYELAFHVTANLEEADVQNKRQELEKSITSHGGVVSFVKNPEKIRLAYPIRHQTSSYFGYFNFNLEMSESVARIHDEVKLNPSVMRFLILKHESKPKAEKEDLVRRLAQAERRRLRITKTVEKPIAQKETAKMGEKAEKALEEKLEEIIDKL